MPNSPFAQVLSDLDNIAQNTGLLVAPIAKLDSAVSGTKTVVDDIDGLFTIVDDVCLIIDELGVLAVALNTIPVVGEIADALDEVVVPVANDVKAVVSPLQNTFKDIDTILGDVVEGITDLEKVMQAISTDIPNVTNVVAVLNCLLEIATPLVNAMSGTAAASRLSKVVDEYNTIKQEVSSDVLPVANAIDDISKVVGEFATELEKAIDEVQDKVGGAIASIEHASSILSPIHEAVKILNDALSPVMWAIDAVECIFEKIIMPIVDDILKATGLEKLIDGFEVKVEKALGIRPIVVDIQNAFAFSSIQQSGSSFQLSSNTSSASIAHNKWFELAATLDKYYQGKETTAEKESLIEGMIELLITAIVGGTVDPSKSQGTANLPPPPPAYKKITVVALPSTTAQLTSSNNALNSISATVTVPDSSTVSAPSTTVTTSADTSSDKKKHKHKKSFLEKLFVVSALGVAAEAARSFNLTAELFEMAQLVNLSDLVNLTAIRPTGDPLTDLSIISAGAIAAANSPSSHVSGNWPELTTLQAAVITESAHLQQLQPIGSLLKNNVTAFQLSLTIPKIFAQQVQDLENVLTAVIDIFQFLDSIDMLDAVFKASSETLTNKLRECKNINAAMPNFQKTISSIESSMESIVNDIPSEKMITTSVNNIEGWVHGANSLASLVNLGHTTATNAEHISAVTAKRQSISGRFAIVTNDLNAISATVDDITASITKINASLCSYASMLKPISQHSMLFSANILPEVTKVGSKMKFVDSILNPLTCLFHELSCTGEGPKAAANISVSFIKSGAQAASTSISSQVSTILDTVIQSSGFTTLDQLNTAVTNATQTFNSTVVTDLEAESSALISKLDTLKTQLQAKYQYTYVNKNGKTINASNQFVDGATITTSTQLIQQISAANPATTTTS